MFRLTILLILSSLIFLSCSKPVAPEYKTYKNFKVETLGLNQSKVKMNLVYSNPNNMRLTMKNTEIDIYINDQFVGHSSTPQAIDIPQNADFLVPIEFMVDMKFLATNSLLAMFGKEVMLKATGKTKVGKSGIYFNFPINYEGKQKFGGL